MDGLYRQASYALAVVAFAFAIILPTIGVVASNGLFVQDAVILGLALVALGLWFGTLDDPH